MEGAMQNKITQCEICGEVFESAEEVRKHMRAEHVDEGNQETAENIAVDDEQAAA
jgi:hypothetical protein